MMDGLSMGCQATTMERKAVSSAFVVLALLGVGAGAGVSLAEAPKAPVAADAIEVRDLFRSARIPNIVVAADGGGLCVLPRGGGDFSPLWRAGI